MNSSKIVFFYDFLVKITKNVAFEFSIILAFSINICVINNWPVW